MIISMRNYKTVKLKCLYFLLYLLMFIAMAGECDDAKCVELSGKVWGTSIITIVQIAFLIDNN